MKPDKKAINQLNTPFSHDFYSTMFKRKLEIMI